jgi:uncharacterized protein YecE (DUF72 family)
MFYIGCPLWGNKEWVGNFFPPRTASKDFLRLYSQRLTSVEGNTTFYALPDVETVRRWRQETPPTFRFCPKVSRDISHAGDLSAKREQVLTFIAQLQHLGTRLGPCFLQLPPAFAPVDLPQLQAFCEFWPKDVRLAVEVRHRQFFQEPYETEVNDLLDHYGAARVVMDTRPIRVGSQQEQAMLQARERKPDLPVHVVATADIVFVRYIGHPHMEVNDQFLPEWTRSVVDWLQAGKTIYFFCHCPEEKYAPGICANFYARVREQVPTLPPLWQEPELDEQPQQGQLF